MKSKQRNKYLLKNTIIFAIGNFGTKMISFFLVPLYTNLLTTKEYGVVDLFTTICMVLVPILTLNIGESVMRFALDKNSDKNRIMCTGIICLITATILGVVILPVSKCFYSLNSYSFYLYLFVISQGYSQVFLCYLRGKEKLVEYSIGNIIQSLATAVLNIIFLAVLKMGIEGYLISYIIANFITAIYAAIVSNVKEVLLNFKLDFLLSKEMIKFSIVLIPNSFMWWIMNSSDRIMVTAMLGAAENGIYAISYKIPTLLTMITTIFTQAWAYSAIREADSDDIDAYSNSIYNNMVSIVVLIAIGLLIFMKPFLRVYVAKSYFTAWMYTPFLMVGFVFMTLGSFLATSYTVNKDSKGYLYSGTFGAIINIILNWILIPKIGIFGAAIATCISYISVFLYRSFDIQKYNKIHIFQKKHLTEYVFLLIVAGTMFIDCNIGIILLFIELVICILIFRKIIFNILSVLKELVINGFKYIESLLVSKMNRK
ncbi:oligosaccharide flippase family protein [Clostridium perfringens]